MANNAAVAQSDQLEIVAGQQLRDADAALVVRVSEAYFNVLVAQDKLQVVKAQKDAVSQQLASAKRNFEVGTATITDTREAQAQFDRMVAAEIASESDLRIKRLALEQITGVANPAPLPLAAKAGLPDLASGTLDQWVNTAMDKSATVAMAQAGLETARLEVRKAEAGHLPTLDLEATYGQARSDGDCTVVSGGQRVCGNASIGVKFTLPIFAGFAIQNRVKETLQLEDKARQDLEAARRGVTQGVRQAYLGVQSGLGQVKALEAAEVSSQSALDATKLGYEVGVRINVDVLNAQTNLFQTKADLAKARYDVLLGGLKLRQAAGTLSSDDVALVAKTLQP
jgi:outer membrane protein